MIRKLKQSAKKSLKSNKKIYGLAIIYLIIILIIRLILLITLNPEYKNTITTLNQMIMYCINDFLLFPLKLGFIYCLIHKSKTIKELFHFYNIKKLGTVSIVNILFIIATRLPNFMKLVLIQNNLGKVIYMFSAIACFIFDIYLFTFEYLFTLNDGDLKISLVTSANITKKCFLKIIWFDLTFILWNLIPYIIFLILCLSHINIGILMLLNEPIMYGIGIYYLPYYNQSKILFLDFIRKS